MTDFLSLLLRLLMFAGLFGFGRLIVHSPPRRACLIIVLANLLLLAFLLAVQDKFHRPLFAFGTTEYAFLLVLNISAWPFPIWRHYHPQEPTLSSRETILLLLGALSGSIGILTVAVMGR